MKLWAAPSAVIYKTAPESGEQDITDILRCCPKNPPTLSAEPLRCRTILLQNHPRSGMLPLSVFEKCLQKKPPRRR